MGYNPKPLPLVGCKRLNYRELTDGFIKIRQLVHALKERQTHTPSPPNKPTFLENWQLLNCVLQQT